MIVIQSATETRDDYGAVVQTWTTFATVWARKRDIRGSEQFDVQQVNPRIAATFLIYWLSGITEKMRISYDGQYWDIRSINEIGRREGLELYAEVRRS